MKAVPTIVSDEQTPRGRLMYYTSDGARYTPEQWQIMQFMERLEKKLERLINLLEQQAPAGKGGE